VADVIVIGQLLGVKVRRAASLSKKCERKKNSDRLAARRTPMTDRLHDIKKKFLT